MKRLMTKLLALCVALAIPGGMALSEPLIVDAANEEEIILPDPESFYESVGKSLD